MTIGLGHELGAVALVGDKVVAAQRVAEDGRIPVDPALDRLGVGVEQQLGRVAAVPVVGLVRAVDPEAVALAGPDIGQVAVPAQRGDLGEGDALLVALVVEQAEVDAGGDIGEQGEVGAGAVVAGAQGERLSGPESHRPGTLPGAGTPRSGRSGFPGLTCQRDGYTRHGSETTPGDCDVGSRRFRTARSPGPGPQPRPLSRNPQLQRGLWRIRAPELATTSTSTTTPPSPTPTIPHENFDKEHEGEAHIHDHEQAVRPTTAKKAAKAPAKKAAPAPAPADNGSGRTARARGAKKAG